MKLPIAVATLALTAGLAALRGQNGAAELAGARVAVVGGRPHHLRRQGTPFSAVSRLPPRDDRRVSSAGRSSAVLCRQHGQRPAVSGR
jgi:hypothetical protein